MDSIRLRRTPEEIREYNRRSKDPLGILRVINQVSARSWIFSFTFRNDEIRLAIQSDPPLTYNDFRSLADGVIPEVHAGTSLMFSESGICSFISRIDDESNVLTLDSWDTPANGMHICFAGTLPSALQNKTALEQTTYDLTWFGSHFLAPIHASKSIQWVLFGDHWTVLPSARDERDDVTSFERALLAPTSGDLIGRVSLSFAARGARTRLYHSRLGLVPGPDAERFDLQSRTRRLKGLGTTVEVDESRLAYTATGDLGPYEAWKVVQSALEVCVDDFTRSAEFLRFLDDQDTAAKERQAEALLSRQRQVESRARLFWSGRELGCVPASENEVMLLLAKLEVLGAIPLPSFRILEYTPGRGIDAIGDFQLSTTGAMERFAPIEVEYNFESFWAHGHAVEQVRLVVCWRFRSEKGVHVSRLERHEEWLYKYVEGRFTMWVILLSRLPNVEQRGG